MTTRVLGEIAACAGQPSVSPLKMPHEGDGVMDRVDVELSNDRRARLVVKGRLLYGKFCGTQGRGTLCRELRPLHHIRRGEAEVARELLAFLEHGGRDAPEATIPMVDWRCPRALPHVRRHLEAGGVDLPGPSLLKERRGSERRTVQETELVHRSVQAFRHRLARISLAISLTILTACLTREKTQSHPMLRTWQLGAIRLRWSARGVSGSGFRAEEAEAAGFSGPAPCSRSVRR